MADKIQLFKIFWDDDDIRAVSAVISRGSYWAEGPEITAFEEKLAEYLDVQSAVVFNNGTSALHAMLLAYGIGMGDEVIVPSFTFISTANAPLFTGARPVFADIEPETLGLDPDDVQNKITPRTKAIMPIHYAGHSCKIDAIKEMASDSNLLLFEDAAEAQGATFKNKKVGSFGDASIFSFCQAKIMTTGEGGAITLNNPNIAKKLKLIRSHGRCQDKEYFTSSSAPDYIELGYNFRLSSMSAALGISQIAKIERIIQMRRSIASKFSNAISNIPGIEPPTELDGCRHVYQLYSVLLENNEKRKGLQAYLDNAGIMSKVYFDPVHLTKHYTDLLGDRRGRLPTTEDIASRTLTLPLYPDMSDEDSDRVIKGIKEYLGE